ncbi:MAG: PASTA domain-containing protein [Candidatus Sumerlaeaceae bacterium]|nr:PASTA domain-containing protein [Candidatus Sumerlaeaceae bacterium]
MQKKKRHRSPEGADSEGSETGRQSSLDFDGAPSAPPPPRRLGETSGFSAAYVDRDPDVAADPAPTSGSNPDDTLTPATLNKAQIQAALKQRGASANPGGGGDTLKMPAIKKSDVRPKADWGPMKGATPENWEGARERQGIPRAVKTRVARLPRRSPRSRFGFFSWVFGFWGLLFRMLLLTVLVLGLTAGIGYEAIRMYISTEQVVVPNVRGMKAENALEILSAKKLNLIRDRAEPTTLVAPGEIIEQKPQPGDTTKEGATVRVVISSGKANFMVPDVINETRENALNKIKGAGLQEGNITYIENASVAKDIVINQNPEPNKGLEAAAPVNLLVSSGPKGTSFLMPELTGKTVAEAKAALAKVGITDIEVNPADAAGQVTGQEPLVGKQVLQTQKVVIHAGK